MMCFVLISKDKGRIDWLLNGELLGGFKSFSLRTFLYRCFKPFYLIILIYL